MSILTSPISGMTSSKVEQYITLINQAQNIFEPEHPDYGATGSAGAADEHAAIQACFDAASAKANNDGVPVVVRMRQNYGIADQITMTQGTNPLAKVLVVGTHKGAGFTRVAGSTLNRMINVSGTTGPKATETIFAGLTLKGSRTTSFYSGDGTLNAGDQGIEIESGHNIHVVFCEFEDFGDTGVFWTNRPQNTGTTGDQNYLGYSVSAFNRYKRCGKPYEVFDFRGHISIGEYAEDCLGAKYAGRFKPSDLQAVQRDFRIDYYREAAIIGECVKGVHIYNPIINYGSDININNGYAIRFTNNPNVVDVDTMYDDIIIQGGTFTRTGGIYLNTASTGYGFSAKIKDNFFRDRLSTNQTRAAIYVGAGKYRSMEIIGNTLSGGTTNTNFIEHRGSVIYDAKERVNSRIEQNECDACNQALSVIPATTPNNVTGFNKGLIIQKNTFRGIAASGISALDLRYNDGYEFLRNYLELTNGDTQIEANINGYFARNTIECTQNNSTSKPLTIKGGSGNRYVDNTVRHLGTGTTAACVQIREVAIGGVTGLTVGAVPDIFEGFVCEGGAGAVIEIANAIHVAASFDKALMLNNPRITSFTNLGLPLVKAAINHYGWASYTPNIAAGASDSFTIAVQGLSTTGKYMFKIRWPYSMAEIITSEAVTATNTLTVYLKNTSGSTFAPGAGTVIVAAEICNFA